MSVKISLYPEIDGEECEFEATARFDFGTPARTYGPPEHCSPEEPTEVEWLSFKGEGQDFKSVDEFETWLAAQGSSFKIDDRCVEQAIEVASEDVDADDRDWREVG